MIVSRASQRLAAALAAALAAPLARQFGIAKRAPSAMLNFNQRAPSFLTLTRELRISPRKRRARLLSRFCAN